jgi:hypothetical protein
MLFLMALGAANVLFVDWIVGPKFAPLWAVRFAVYGALLGWALLVPYFFYVVRFLDPSNIITRLKEQTIDAVDAAEAGSLDVEQAQDIVHERLFQIGTIILKSLDRADRSVALEGIWSLKLILDHYGEHKTRMKDAWFVVDRKDFVGFSTDALEILNEERTWFEMKVHTQLFLAYQHALAKTSDAINSISDANRVVAVAAAKRGDRRATELAIRYFNNFLREAIKKKDMRAIYDVFYQYRLLARDLVDDAPLLREIVRYFRYYGEVARGSGLDFIQQLAAIDVGYIVRRAYEAKSAAARDLLAEGLAIDHVRKGDLLTLAVKAKIILGGFFLENGLGAEAEIVRENLREVPATTLATLSRELLSAERTFWEVTERQVNLEFIPVERRPHVQAFVASFESAPAAV